MTLWLLGGLCYMWPCNESFEKTFLEYLVIKFPEMENFY